MSDSVLLDKSGITLQSTQQALNILRNLRQKRKKESPTLLYELVKQIYSSLKDPNHKKGLAADTISSDQYLGNNRQSIQDMLLYVKDKVINAISVQSTVNMISNNNPEICQQKQGKQSIYEKICQNCAKQPNSIKLQEIDKLKIYLKEKEQQIQRYNETIKNLQHQTKSIQIKLLNNIKRLNTQIQEKDTQIKQFRQILEDKDQQIDELNKLLQKKHKKIRKLQEDMYDLQLQLQQKNQQLQAEKQCADFLQKKIGKVLQIQSHFSQISHKLQQKQNEQKATENELQSKLQIGIQTDCQSHSSSPSSEQNNQNQPQNDDKISQNSSILTQSKQSKYIESIQRLTAQLGQAYQRINQLMKDGQIADPETAIEMFSAENIRVEIGGKRNGKSKTKSGYFSKFWK